MRYLFFLVLLVLSQIALRPLPADNRLPAAGVVGSIQIATGADKTLFDIVSRALTVQLSRRQALLQLVELPASPPSSRAPEGLSKAEGQNAQYLILCEYSTSPRDFTLEADLYDVGTRQMVRTSTASGRIDLSLDSVVADVLDKSLAGIVLRPLPTAATAAAAAAAPVVAPVVPFVSRFAFTGSAAPFIPMGGASTYANLGVLVTVSADYRFPLGPGVMGAGLLSGVCVLNAAGAATDARLLMVPIGVDVNYSMNEGSFPGIVLHVSGGPALMNVTADYAGSLTKVVPYVLAGMSLGIPFTPSIGLAVEADWAAFLESLSLPIMAFAPEVSLYVRF